MLAGEQVSYIHNSLLFWPACPVTWNEYSGPPFALSALLRFTTPVAGQLVIAEGLSPFSLWLLASKGFSLVALLPAFLSLWATKALTVFACLPSLLPIRGQGFPVTGMQHLKNCIKTEFFFTYNVCKHNIAVHSLDKPFWTSLLIFTPAEPSHSCMCIFLPTITALFFCPFLPVTFGLYLPSLGNIVV